MASSSSRTVAKKELEVLTDLARRAKANLQSAIPETRFGRLRRSIRYVVTRSGITLYSIYYWARWANDGRGPVKAAEGRVLVWFLDPQDDPRIAADYPKKPKSVVRLTKRQFQAAFEAGEIAIAKRVGKAAGLHFLEKGIAKTRTETPGILRQLLAGRARDRISRGDGKITVRLGR